MTALPKQSAEVDLLAPARRFRLPGRAGRVFWLTGGIFLLSMADLWQTLVYLRSVGMGELNPVARWIMDHLPPIILVLWKIASVSTGCLILISLRSKRSAEVASWICCVVMVWLTIRWCTYNREASHLTPFLHTIAENDTAKWVRSAE
ncbi:MAG TPA: DUF5658 family protein [Phycisphaerales bacterium]|nr:DUF5658 family protein [Phycisphaerales bacterium]